MKRYFLPKGIAYWSKNQGNSQTLIDTHRHLQTLTDKNILTKIYLFQNHPLHSFNNRIHFIKGKCRLVGLIHTDYNRPV